MNQLISLRTNIWYAKEVKKNEPDVFVRMQELILLVEKPVYSRTNDGEIIRERGVNELRFTVTEKGYAELLAALLKLKDIDESELG